MIISNAEHLFCRRKAILLVRHCCYGLTCVGAIGFKALLSWLIITVLGTLLSLEGMLLAPVCIAVSPYYF